MSVAAADVTFILASKVSEMPQYGEWLPGSRQVACGGCGVMLWASPSTFQTFGDPPCRPLFCIDCATAWLELRKAARKQERANA